MFAAALILGFSLFVEKDINVETEAMFTGACDIMSLFSIGSPQAARYYKILTHLAQTISRQRQKDVLYHGRQRRESLGRLFHQNPPHVTDSLPTPSEIHTADDIRRQDESGQSDSIEQIDSWPTDDVEDTSLSGQAMIDPAFYGWDSLHLPLWDSFPFIE